MPFQRLGWGRGGGRYIICQLGLGSTSLIFLKKSVNGPIYLRYNCILRQFRMCVDIQDPPPHPLCGWATIKKSNFFLGFPQIYFLIQIRLDGRKRQIEREGGREKERGRQREGERGREGGREEGREEGRMREREGGREKEEEREGERKKERERERSIYIS